MLLFHGHRGCGCYSGRRASGQGKWRNGRRARFRSVCPKGREGSTPSFRTEMANLNSPRSWPADVGVGLVFLGSVGLITLVMLTLVILFSAKILA